MSFMSFMAFMTFMAGSLHIAHWEKSVYRGAWQHKKNKKVAMKSVYRGLTAPMF
jgi:hypothetical protein